uniref:Glycosyltransferase 2-like domain-containing protein n=1 Tax=Fagus sylvatica TaxID=28930 RepID=A0A2N9ER71_FAGSY
MGEITQKIVLPETFQGVRDELAGQIGMMWELIKAPLMVLLLRLGVYICLAMSLMLFCERLYMGIVIILVKLFWKKPEKSYKYETIQEDVEMGSSNFPVVLIQIPMYNERDVRFCDKMVPVVEATECNDAWDSKSDSTCSDECTKRHKGEGICSIFPPLGAPSDQCYCLCTWQLGAYGSGGAEE